MNHFFECDVDIVLASYKTWYFSMVSPHRSGPNDRWTTWTSFQVARAQWRWASQTFQQLQITWARPTAARPRSQRHGPGVGLVSIDRSMGGRSDASIFAILAGGLREIPGRQWTRRVRSFRMTRSWKSQRSPSVRLMSLVSMRSYPLGHGGKAHPHRAPFGRSPFWNFAVGIKVRHFIN